ncbi:Aste57867_2284 [Aphanomyces stellatus]|uniref:Aste57867_2284 protein n=1 Tax=Aphanomyces stellatus TaxID=120398 RepID=A0A485KCE8_9STRA|nr:hypothetical protein As57867_002279 [Aphanomyces stellatus]VFT79487.1 Aste57867_2284 [Aphanomyces stellatus]
MAQISLLQSYRQLHLDWSATRVSPRRHGHLDAQHNPALYGCRIKSWLTAPPGKRTANHENANELKKTSAGQYWLSAMSASVKLPVTDEMLQWQAHKIAYFVTQWQYFKRIGLVILRLHSTIQKSMGKSGANDQKTRRKHHGHRVFGPCEADVEGNIVVIFRCYGCVQLYHCPIVKHVATPKLLDESQFRLSRRGPHMSSVAICCSPGLTSFLLSNNIQCSSSLIFGLSMTSQDSTVIESVVQDILSIARLCT